MKLKINIMKQLFGLSANGIKLYEKEGILKPSRQLDNGYREYNTSELQLMGFATQMRSFGYSMQELETFIHKASDEEQLAGYYTKAEAIDREINRMTSAKKSLLAEAAHTEYTYSIMGKCITGISESTYFFGMRRGNVFLSEYTPAMTGKWICQYAPHVSSAIILDGPYITVPGYDREVLYGVSVDARIALDCGIELSKDVVFMPPKRSVITGIKLNYRDPDFSDAISRVKGYAEEHKLDLQGGGFIRLNQALHDKEELEVTGIFYAPLKGSESDFGIMV